MKLKDWKREDRPRERIFRDGVETLGNAELLAVFIGSGTVGKNAVDIGQELLSSAGGRLTELCGRPPKKLMEHKGIGEARAVVIAAALELGRRYFAEASAGKTVIKGPEDVYNMMLPLLKGRMHEECWALYLNRANLVTAREKLTSGTADATLFDTRLIVRNALEHQAKGVILVHNHPSGSPLPGESDIRATRQLQLALKTFDIHLFDHVVLGDGCYYSFGDERVTKKHL